VFSQRDIIAKSILFIHTVGTPLIFDYLGGATNEAKQLSG
jgi:hypothetical protein